MTIAIGADHAGFALKESLLATLRQAGYHLQDYGTYSAERSDYPDAAHPVANAVSQGQASLGILICGSGNGVCITANRHPGIRAALCWLPELATLARSHNNANIVCLPARFVDVQTAEAITLAFLTTPFEGGRHEQRILKINQQ